jgi:hypothetical protein
MKKELFATEKEGKIVDFMAVFGRQAQIPSRMSTDLECSECKGKEHYAPYKFSAEYPGQIVDNRRVWICANPQCPTMQMKNIPSTYDPKKYEKNR